MPGAWRVEVGTGWHLKEHQQAVPAFWACYQEMGEERCINKPSREWVETHPPDRAGYDASQVDTAPPPSDGEFDDLPF